MPRLSGQILLRLRRVARRDFLPQLASNLHMYSNPKPGHGYHSQASGRHPGGGG